MRAINIFILFSVILIEGCSTIEVAKEVTKATKIVKTSIEKISKKNDQETIQEQNTSKNSINLIV